MADLTPAELTELRRLLEAATPGPWRQGNMEPWHIFTPHGASIGPDRVLLRMNMANTRDWAWNADAALIAALVNAAPRLLAMAGLAQPLDCHGCDERLFAGGDFEPVKVEAHGYPGACPHCVAAPASEPVGGRWQHFDGAMVDPVAPGDDYAEEIELARAHNGLAVACERLRDVRAQLAERDAEVARLNEALEIELGENRQQADQIHRLAAKLAEARRELQQWRNVNGGVIAGIGDGITRLQQERDAAQAALAQAQRERDEARRHAEARTQDEIALWAAEQVRAFPRGARIDTKSLADRIARGPQPAERGEEE